MEVKKPASKKVKRKEKLLACGRLVLSLVKDLQEKWDASGLLSELGVHAMLLKRIRHQFRRSKFVQRSLSIQSCARRLPASTAVRLRTLISKTGSFETSMADLLAELANREALMRQMSAYAGLTGEASTQAMAQEHYFFFGTDLSMLATCSRIWVLSRAIAESLGDSSGRIREALRNADVKIDHVEDTFVSNSIAAPKSERSQDDLSPVENSFPEVLPSFGNSKTEDPTTATRKKSKKKITSGALGRFTV